MTTTELENQPQKGKRAKAAQEKPEKVKRPAREKKHGAKPAAEAPAWPSAVRPALVFLPPKIRSAQTFKKSVRQSMMMSVGMLALAGVAYVAVVASTGGVEQDLAESKERGVRLTQEIAEEKPVQDYWLGVVERKAAVADALENDLAYGKVVSTVMDANSVGATFTKISTPDAGDSCTTSNPFVENKSVGCLEVTGTVENVRDIGTLVDRLNNAGDLLTNAYTTETTTVNDVVTFKLTVGYTEKALSFKNEPFRPSEEEMEYLNQFNAPEAEGEAEAAPDAGVTIGETK